MPNLQTLITATLVGIGGTLIFDAVMALMARFLGYTATNWRMVGRWMGHIPNGQFIQRSLKDAKPILGETILGWSFHYAIGIGYGLLLALIWGADWFADPQLAQPMSLSIALLVLPYFIMMPGMGLGIAASRAPSPNVARLKSVFGHSVFGLGLFLAALVLEIVS
ncbi:MULTISPECIES: DUF2938 family protein [Sulfitobacter]|uniref:DUF2938 domain-containing protein n=1 Tax=Sulfitobacter dubius TaxID=218673 RepID=A0ABY3ZML0_9RHOB|nr:DUF2938 family protein [Sulfitobacter dubius]UOA15856.1 hypothetical protein DSM109990_02700 [Sulfitobacter dubius]WOI28756.1 DUF2938 family protein [Sulfitobacter dubius]